LDAWHHSNCHILLIVDECHRAGSDFNARIFEGKYDSSLGLSATPEREDGGHAKYVYPGLGPPIYRYGLLSALDDGVLAPVRSVNLYVDFDNTETAKWQRLSDKIADAFRSVRSSHSWLDTVAPEELMKEIAKLAKAEDLAALHLQKALTDRRTLLAEAGARIRCQHAILDWVSKTDRRALVFHETIKAAEESWRYLQDVLHVRTSLDHSQLNQAKREKAADDFRHGHTRVLVAVRALDEGVDVPDASVAVIGAGSRSRRQRIQRFGRVLRKVDDKEALVVSVLVRGTPEESVVGGADEALIGAARVRHHRWPGQSARPLQ
jgi:superfamily II DNA or RNA helicase